MTGSATPREDGAAVSAVPMVGRDTRPPRRLEDVGVAVTVEVDIANSNATIIVDVNCIFFSFYFFLFVMVVVALLFGWLF